MLKQWTLFGAILALLAGCTGVREGSNSSSSSGGSGSHGATSGSSGSTGTSATTGTSAGSTSTAGSSGSSGGACTHVATVAAIRTLPTYTKVCVDNAVTLMASSPGTQQADGGFKYNGDYYVADSSGAIHVHKYKFSPPTGDPTRGQSVSVESELVMNPKDGGAGDTELELADPNLAITNVSTGTVPAPKTPTAAQLDHAGGDVSLIGQYVTVPSGTYTQDSAPTEFKYQTYVDGVKLTDGTSTILVAIYPFSHELANCGPADGGFPDLSHGGFKGVFDWHKTDDGNANKVVIFGDCADLH